MRGVIAASSKKGCVQGAASAGGVSISSFPNGDTRGRATNDVNATPGAKFRAGHQKHHSVVGHLDSRPAPHYKQLLRRAESKLLSCSFPMSRGPPAYTVQAPVDPFASDAELEGLSLAEHIRNFVWSSKDETQMVHTRCARGGCGDAAVALVGDRYPCSTTRSRTSYLLSSGRSRLGRHP